MTALCRQQVHSTHLPTTLTIVLFILCTYICSRTCGEYFKRQDICPGRTVTLDNCPESRRTSSVMECAGYCGQNVSTCTSFLLDSNSSSCLLCTAVATEDCANTAVNPVLRAYELKCLNGGYRQSGQCQCPRGYGGDHCQHRMIDCVDWSAAGDTGEDQLRWVYPHLSPEPFQIMCSFTWGRFLIMSRTSPSLDFYRNWTEYANGFGDVAADHWLGLHKLHQLTHARCYFVGIEMHTSTGWFQQFYEPFHVADESQHFAMSFSWTFPGDNVLGDSLSDVNGKPFSTYDADHDDDVTGSCAKRHHSGWWFGDCTLGNPTGILAAMAGKRTGDPQEVFWTNDQDQDTPSKIIMFLHRCKDK